MDKRENFLRGRRSLRRSVLGEVKAYGTDTKPRRGKNTHSSLTGEKTGPRELMTGRTGAPARRVNILI